MSSRAAARRAAVELAAHRRRLLEITRDPDLDSNDALLLRIDPRSTSAVLDDFLPNHPADFPAPPFAVSNLVAVGEVTSHVAAALTTDLRTNSKQVLRMQGSGPEGQTCESRAKTEHGEDAGSVNSTAIRPTEDVAE